MINCRYEVELVREAWISCFTIHGFLIILMPSYAAFIVPSGILYLSQSYSTIDTTWNIPASYLLYEYWSWNALGRCRRKWLGFSIFIAFYHKSFCDLFFLEVFIDDSNSCSLLKCIGCVYFLGSVRYIGRSPEDRFHPKTSPFSTYNIILVNY